VSIVLLNVSWETICGIEGVLFSRLVSGSESFLTSLLLGVLNTSTFFLHHRLVDGALVYA